MMGKFKLFGQYADKETELQIKEMRKSPAFAGERIAIMPDNHLGKGACIGFTGTFSDKIIPNVVGVDIGCGMMMAKMPLEFMGRYNENKQEAFKELQTFIRKNIPYGQKVNPTMNKDFQYHWTNEFKKLSFELSDKDRNHFIKSIGSLGGGNHFIEVNKSEERLGDGQLHLIVHTGSRGLGKMVAEHHQKIAESNFKTYSYTDEELKAVPKEQRAEWIAKKREEFAKQAPTKGLEYLIGSQVDDYINDMKIAQRFAHVNRYTIIQKILTHFEGKEKLFNFIETVHNYIDIEEKIIRKGAVEARDGNLIIIPLNMRDGTIIAYGKSNGESNYSAPHGAGRIMSRTKAKEVVKLEDFKETMSNVISWTVNENTLDESPFAYKPQNEIIEGIEELVKIIEIIKPEFNFKDDSSSYNRKKKNVRN